MSSMESVNHDNNTAAAPAPAPVPMPVSNPEETALAIAAMPSVFADLPKGVNRHVYSALKVDPKTGLSALSNAIFNSNTSSSSGPTAAAAVPDSALTSPEHAAAVAAAAVPLPKRRRVATDGFDAGNAFLAQQIVTLTHARALISRASERASRAALEGSLYSAAAPGGAAAGAGAAALDQITAASLFTNTVPGGGNPLLGGSGGGAAADPLSALSAPAAAPPVGALVTEYATAGAPIAITGIPNDPARRVHLSSLDYTVTEGDVLAIVSAVVGPVTKVDMPRDTDKRHTKGFCFVEFAHQADAVRAMTALNGYLVAGRAMRANLPRLANPQAAARQAPALLTVTPLVPVVPTQVPHGPASSHGHSAGAAQGAAGADGGGGAGAGVSSSGSNTECRVFLAQIAPEFNEDHLRAIFSAFGEVRSCNLIQDHSTGRHKGHGFLEFATEASAKMAMEKLNGQKLGSRNIVVKPTNNPAPSNMNNMSNANAFAPAVPAPAYASMPAPVSAASSATDNTAPQQQQSQATVSTVRLRNMFTEADLAEATVAELTDEVADECRRWGTVRAVTLVRNNDNGELEVFVAYGTTAEAQQAVAVLHGRRFANRSVVAAVEPLAGTPLQ